MEKIASEQLSVASPNTNDDISNSLLDYQIAVADNLSMDMPSCVSSTDDQSTETTVKLSNSTQAVQNNSQSVLNMIFRNLKCCQHKWLKHSNLSAKRVAFKMKLDYLKETSRALALMSQLSMQAVGCDMTLEELTKRLPELSKQSTLNRTDKL